MKATVLVMAALCGGLLGCNRATEPKTQAAAAPPVPASTAAVSSPAPASPPSTMETIVDGFTGRAVIQKGNETREKVKAIGAKEQSDLEEAMK